MDDLFPLLMFVIFILGPILEGLKRKNKKQAPPEQRRPLPRAPQQRLPQPTSRTEEISAGPRRQESAATMVPDDLWEILTGQKRPPVTTPQQLPPAEKQRPHWDVVYDPEAEAEQVGAESARTEDVNVEIRRAKVEAQSLETLERHAEPVIVSLEENLPTAAERHAAFHKKVSAPVAVVLTQERHPLLGLGSRAELRRAFLLQEVFNKPKGLE